MTEYSIIVGNHTYGHESVNYHIWDTLTGLIIGKYCSISSNVEIFLGGNHRADWVTTFSFGHAAKETFSDKKFEGHPYSKGDIIIGHDVLIYSGACIFSGVNIGNGAIIGAKSVVTKDVPPYTIVAGNPAREIGKRFPDNIISELQEIAFWDLPDSIVNELKEDLSKPPTIVSLDILKQKIKRLKSEV